MHKQLVTLQRERKTWNRIIWPLLNKKNIYCAFLKFCKYYAKHKPIYLTQSYFSSLHILFLGCLDILLKKTTKIPKSLFLWLKKVLVTNFVCVLLEIHTSQTSIPCVFSVLYHPTFNSSLFLCSFLWSHKACLYDDGLIEKQLFILLFWNYKTEYSPYAFLP